MGISIFSCFDSANVAFQVTGANRDDPGTLVIFGKSRKTISDPRIIDSENVQIRGRSHSEWVNHVLQNQESAKKDAIYFQNEVGFWVGPYWFRGCYMAQYHFRQAFPTKDGYHIAIKERTLRDWVQNKRLAFVEDGTVTIGYRSKYVDDNASNSSYDYSYITDDTDSSQRYTFGFDPKQHYSVYSRLNPTTERSTGKKRSRYFSI